MSKAPGRSAFLLVNRPVAGASHCHSIDGQSLAVGMRRIETVNITLSQMNMSPWQIQRFRLEPRPVKAVKTAKQAILLYLSLTQRSLKIGRVGVNGSILYWSHTANAWCLLTITLASQPRSRPLTVTCLRSFLVSMMLAPSIPQVLSEFRPSGGSESLGSFAVTVYILGFCVGPLLLGPLADLYGRTVVCRLSIVGFLAFTVGCALAPSLEALIVFRLFAGCFGGAPMSIGGAVVADMYEPGSRDGPMAAYSVGTMMGPTVGPVLGGVTTGLLGWRWVFWTASMLVGCLGDPRCWVRRLTCVLMCLKSGVAAIGLFLILPETHLPTLKKRHAWRLVEITPQGTSKTWCADGLDLKALARTVARAVSLPTKISLYPPVFLILLLICIFNGLVNMILSSQGSIYQARYDFQPTVSGLSYLGIGFGGLAALIVTKPVKRYLTRVANSRGIVRGPEGSLIFLAMVPPVTTVGLLWYGWSLQRMAHWIVPIAGLFCFGFGYMCTRVETSFLHAFQRVPDGHSLALRPAPSCRGCPAPHRLGLGGVHGRLIDRRIGPAIVYLSIVRLRRLRMGKYDHLRYKPSHLSHPIKYVLGITKIRRSMGEGSNYVGRKTH